MPTHVNYLFWGLSATRFKFHLGPLCHCSHIVAPLPPGYKEDGERTEDGVGDDHMAHINHCHMVVGGGWPHKILDTQLH